MLKFIARWKFLLAALFAVSLAGCAVVPYQSSGYIATGSTPYQSQYGYRGGNPYGDFYGTPYSTFGSSGVGIGLQYYSGGGRSHGYRGAHRSRSGASHRGGWGRHSGGHRGGGHRGR
ncbi:hypothetical protein QN362_18330 [Actimicrobium sp. CCC2.4]|uniref:hypothetical protein n=1 Tax=Actimicrobium sp. CCC2.4 TaxID=3048606 RepID=UPI002AC93B95|nr:hypothetical protein [Actimicrobium sp. CCC2.4]MEB0137293.1 hypothetical protein [Actimicrobium sp. CCC2.4]WPX32525.1 hypothetical protein RHM62_01355 [Actimicrobium sp. CCC2.4]